MLYIVGLAYLLDRFVDDDRAGAYLVAVLDAALARSTGELMTRRRVGEIVEGWHVVRGYMWPYVLLTYCGFDARARRE